ncbi:MAG: hypothetical protein J6M62_12385 [Selenomonadaceae bacterium]|nr:hypothetical protein [Selenomonadaceae bacterium]
MNKKFIKSERGFVSFFALMALIAASFIGSGLMILTNESAKTTRHHEIAAQLRYDAESAVEKIACDIENKKLILPNDIKYIDEYVVYAEYLPHFESDNKTLKASIKYANGGIRIFAIAEKTDEQFTTLGTAEGFMQENEGEYKWKYWIKVK